jgi:hypothetical protein
MRRQERRQLLVDVTGTPVPAFDGTQADGQQTGQIALPAPFGPTTNVSRSLRRSPNWSKDSTPAPDSDVIRTRRV